MVATTTAASFASSVGAYFVSWNSSVLTTFTRKRTPERRQQRPQACLGHPQLLCRLRHVPVTFYRLDRHFLLHRIHRRQQLAGDGVLGFRFMPARDSRAGRRAQARIGCTILPESLPP